MDAPAHVPAYRRRWLRRLTRAALFGVVAFGLLWIVSYFRALHRRDAALQTLRERGEPTTLEEYFERESRKPKTETGRDPMLAALALHRELGAPGGRLGPLASQRGATAPTPADAATLAALASAEEVVEKIRQATRLPPGRFAGPAELALNFPFAQDFRSLCRLLAGRCTTELAAGRPDDAFRTLALGFDLCEQLRDEPFLVPQLVRIAILGVFNERLRYCLQHATPNDAAVRELDRRLVAAFEGFSWRPTFENERLASSAELSDVQTVAARYAENRQTIALNSRMPSWLALQIADRRFDLVASPLGLPLRLGAQADALALPDDVIAMLDKPPPWTDAEERLFQEWNARYGNYAVLGVSGNSVLAGSYEANRRIRRRLTLTRWLLHLKVYRQTTDRFPERLAQICNPAMPALDLTWFENLEPQYSANGDGLRIRFDERLNRLYPVRDDNYLDAYGLLLDFQLGEKAK